VPVVTDVNKPINTMLLALKLSPDYHKMSATPDVVADPTNDGTLRPNLELEVSTGDNFEPLFCLQFDSHNNLPPNVEKDDPFSI